MYIELVHCVYYWDQYECDPTEYPEAIRPTYFGPDGRPKPWVGVYYFKGESKPIIIEGYFENPYNTWRYRKNTGETFGTCDVFDALPTILVANQAARAFSRIVQYSADPPLVAPEQLRGQIEWKPRGITYTEFPDPNIKPLLPAQNPTAIVSFMERTSDTIMKMLKADVYLMLENMTHQKTAQEVIQLQGEKIALLGTVAGRMGTEYLDPQLKRIFGIELRGGRIPPAPQDLIPLIMNGNVELSIDYQGPLFQMQRQLREIGQLQQGLSAIQPVLEMFPQTAIRLNPDGIMMQFIQASGMPAQTYRDDQEVQQIQQAQAIQAAQQQKAVALQQLSQAYQQTTKAPDPGSGAEMIQNAIQGGNI
jgi:hypothetical protein